MAEPLSSLIRPHLGPVLPALERLAPPPPDNVVAAEIEARTAPGDIIVELHGRGAWVARGAINRLRRTYDLESLPLTRLVADLVLRPPDLRHLDAAINALAVQPHGNAGIRQAINESFSSHCPTCGRSVIVDEFIWEGDSQAPSRKSYRCSVCRPGEAKLLPVDNEDVERAAAANATRARAALLPRYPVPEGGHPIADQLLNLYTARTLIGLAGILERIESELRADSISAALRLALVQVLLPASRLNSYPGRVAALRISSGRIRRPTDRQWRERNPWLLFEDGCRVVRAFAQRLEGGTTGHIRARIGRDLAGLLDGSSNVVVRQRGDIAAEASLRLPADRHEMPGPLDPRARIRLVLTQPPPHWTPENLGFAYHATSLAMGYADASNLPLGALFRPPPRGEWAWDAALLRHSLVSVRPVLAHDAQVVLLLDRSGPGGLVAGVLGGVAAGYRLNAALLTEIGDEIGGTLEFVASTTSGSRDARIVELPSESDPNAPFELSAVESAVSDIAVAALQARGEPARFERLLGEVLIGLDRTGHLRRFVGTETFVETEQLAEAGATEAGVIVEAPAPPDGHLPAGGPSAATTARPSERAPGAASAPAGRSASSLRAGASRSWRDPMHPVRAPMAVPAAAPRTANLAAPGPPLAAEAPLAAEPLFSAEPQFSAEPPLAGGPPLPAGPPPGAGDTAPAAAPGDALPAPGAGPTAPAPGPEAVRATNAGRTSAPGPFDRTMPDELVVKWSGPSGAASAGDPVSLLLEIVHRRASAPRPPATRGAGVGALVAARAADTAATRTPLSDRLEWAVFSLLSTSGGLTESAFFDRIAGHVPRPRHARRGARPRLPGLVPGSRAGRGRSPSHRRRRCRRAPTSTAPWSACSPSAATGSGCAAGSRRASSAGSSTRPAAGRACCPRSSSASTCRSSQPAIPEALEAVDCIWYLRGKATLLLRGGVDGHARRADPPSRCRAFRSRPTLVRFLVVPPERTELLRLKLARSPLLRERMEDDNWHILKSDHVRRLWAREEASLEDLEPMLGLDPEIERQAEQLAAVRLKNGCRRPGRRTRTEDP